MQFKKIIFLSIFLFSQLTISQDYANEFLKPVCPDYKKSGSLSEANVLGMLLTLGMSTAGSFSCNFYINYDGTYPSDCNELRCRIKNQQVILNNANHVIKISKDVISNKNTSSSPKQKQIKQGLVKIDEALKQWKKVSSDSKINKDTSSFIEKNLNTSLEVLIFKQLEILPYQAKATYFKEDSRKEKERKRIAAEREKESKRIAAEREKERQIVAAEKRRVWQIVAAERQKEREEKLFWSFTLSFIVSLFLIIFVMVYRKTKRDKLKADKLKADEEKREKLAKKINQHMNAYEKIYTDKLNRYKDEFKELYEKVISEEEELVKLKGRHPKIKFIVSSRKIGDSKSITIKNIEKLLTKL
jgi:hypothetical protein